MWLSCTQYFHLLTESCVESLLLASPSPSPQLYIYISILIHVAVSIHQARCTPAPSHILPTYLFYNHKPSTLTNTHPTQSLSLFVSLSLTHTHTHTHTCGLHQRSGAVFSSSQQRLSKCMFGSSPSPTNSKQCDKNFWVFPSI